MSPNRDLTTIIRARIAVLITIVSILAGSVPSYSASVGPEDRVIRYVRGRVCSIDYAGSRVAIEWLYTTGKMSKNTMTFFIPNTVSVLTEKDEIFNKIRRAGIIDLVIGDHIIIKYYDDKKIGYPEAISIKILEHDAPMVP